MVEITVDELIVLGYKEGKQADLAIKLAESLESCGPIIKKEALNFLKDILDDPQSYLSIGNVPAQALIKELTGNN